MAKAKQAIQPETDKKIRALSIPEQLGQVPALHEKQILHILQRTPKAHVFRRPGKGGGQWEYVTGTYVEKVLNYAFGWDWSFEVKEHGREGNLVWVLGKLTIHSSNGNSLIKEQFGRADVKKSKTGGDLDFGNDMKAAATDALKKCASLMGVASDIYGKEEFKEVKIEIEAEPDDTKPATEAQLNTMKTLEIEFKPEITRGEAREAIRLATGKQVNGGGASGQGGGGGRG